MIITHLNYLAVLVCGIIYFAIGGAWYSPMLFSKAWMAGHKITMPTGDEAKAAMKKQMPKMMGFSLLVSLLASVAVGYLEVMGCIFTPMGGAKVGLIAGFFCFMALALSHMYTGKSVKTTMIDAGYHIVSLIVVGIILAVWK